MLAETMAAPSGLTAQARTPPLWPVGGALRI